MKLKILAFIVLVFISGILSAQKTKSVFIEKNNQHSISAEFAAVSYSYAHKFKPKVILGARVQIGFGFQIFLTNPAIQFDFGYGDGLETIRVGGFGSLGPIDILKLQFFYRRSISSCFYLEAGPIASFNYMEHDWANNFSVGIETSAFYTIRKIHLGFRIKGTLSFDPQNSEITSESSYFALFATPLVIGFNF
jgi:hypothetical protein